MNDLAKQALDQAVEFHERVRAASELTWPDASVGREIWHANHFVPPRGAIDGGHVTAYLEQERRTVMLRGQCSAGCDQTEQIQHHTTGRVVCPHTLEPCHLRHITPFLELWNNHGND